MATSNDVLSAYMNLLNRKPDASGQSFWNGAAPGMSPDQMTAAFKASPEFQAGPGIDWSSLGQASKNYLAGQRAAPGVLNYQSVPTDPAAARAMMLTPRAQSADTPAPSATPTDATSSFDLDGLMKMLQSDPSTAQRLMQILNSNGSANG